MRANWKMEIKCLYFMNKQKSRLDGIVVSGRRRRCDVAVRIQASTVDRFAGVDGIPADAQAVAFNLTAVAPAEPGYVTVYPQGTQQPVSSNLNHARGTSTTSGVISKIGDDGEVCFYVHGGSRLVADVVGYWPGMDSCCAGKACENPPFIGCSGMTDLIDGVRQVVAKIRATAAADGNNNISSLYTGMCASSLSPSFGLSFSAKPAVKSLSRLLPRTTDDDGNLVLRIVLDEKGQMSIDNTCPVNCGRCCRFWRQVRSLSHLSDRNRDADRCPHLRKNGCRLKRSKMPAECRAFLCELGYLAHEGLITAEEIQLALDAGMQDEAAAFLGKEIDFVLNNQTNQKTSGGLGRPSWI